MKFKAIVSDFDGTLVGKDRKVAQPVIDAVQKWLQSGRHFTIATGNQFVHMNHIYKELSLKDPQILRGGTEIIDPTTGQFVWREYIPYKTAKDIIDYLQNNSVHYHAEADDNTVYTFDGKEMWYPGVKFQHIQTLPQKDISKIVILQKDRTYPEIDSERTELFVKEKIIPLYEKQMNIHQSITPHSTSWDITSKKANKQFAIEQLVHLLKISPSEIIGIGDSPNDIPILSASGYKVVMGNTSSEELRKIADYVAPSFTENGVATVIQKFLKEDI
jgi:Cof subfamily protein (haloacid dehalogenase superfamily)